MSPATYREYSPYRGIWPRTEIGSEPSRCGPSSSPSVCSFRFTETGGDEARTILTLNGVKHTQQPLTAGGAKRRSRLLTAPFRCGQDTLKVAIASQGIEVPHLRKGVEREIALRRRAMNVSEAHFVRAGVAQQPSFDEGGLRIVLNLQCAEGQQAIEHLRRTTLEPRHEQIAPGTKGRNARGLAHVGNQADRLVAAPRKPQRHDPDPVVGPRDRGRP